MGQQTSGPSEQDAKARHQRKPDTSNIEPGMNVEATGFDPGESDISKPKVAEVALLIGVVLLFYELATG